MSHGKKYTPTPTTQNLEIITIANIDTQPLIQFIDMNWLGYSQKSATKVENEIPDCVCCLQIGRLPLKTLACR